MNTFEIVGEVCERLHERNIRVVMSGGSAVAYYTRNRYLTNDFDLVDVYNDGNKKIGAVMRELGFVERGRYFYHPGIEDLMIEFPTGPLQVGNERIDPETVETVATAHGTLYLLSATDCVKDRLAAYHAWDNEIQSLYQAVLVSLENDIDMDALERWAGNEKNGTFFERFKQIRNEIMRHEQMHALLDDIDRFDTFVYRFFLDN